MRSLTIRKARLKDYRVFRTLYKIPSRQVLYRSPKEFSVRDSSPLPCSLDSDLEFIEQELSNCSYKTFKSYVRNTYIIECNGQIACGYITFYKDCSKLKINDITILPDSLLGGSNFAKLIAELSDMENVTEMYVCVSLNPQTVEMLEMAGFERENKHSNTMRWKK